MYKIRYFIIYNLLSVVAWLPFAMLYFVSDLAFLLVYYLIGYRKQVVFDNLRYAFPEKNEKEINAIARKFYIHFCDYLFESVKIIHISNSEINRRFVYKNIGILDDIFHQNKSVVLVSAHQGNWEWMIGVESKIEHKFLAVYKPLLNKDFDKLLKKIREKFAGGAELIAMDEIYKKLLTQKQKGQKCVSWFLVDQAPPKKHPYWIKFMNRETPFYNGPAKIAIKFDQPMVFMEIHKLKRGFYEAEFSMLTENPTLMSEDKIVEQYVRKIEEGIRKQPEYWLWSHRRWKHKKEK